MDECATNEHDCDENAICENIPNGGSFTCACKDGYHGDGNNCSEGGKFDQIKNIFGYRPMSKKRFATGSYVNKNLPDIILIWCYKKFRGCWRAIINPSIGK